MKGHIFGPGSEFPREKSLNWMGICVIFSRNC